MTKKLSIFSVLIAVLISLVPLSVFGYSGGEYDIIVVPVLEEVAKTQTTRADYSWASRIYNNTRQYYNLFRRPGEYEGDVYVFAVKESNVWKPYFVTTEDTGSTNLNISYSQNYDSNWKYPVSAQQYSSNYELYYRAGSGGFYYSSFGTEQECYLTEFNSIDAGLSAIRTGLNNGTIGGGSGNVSHNVTINVPVNNIAYIGFANGTADISIYTGGGNNVVYSPHVSNASYWFSDTLPSGSNYASLSSGTKFIFTGRGDRTIWLGYYYAGTTLELEGVRYLVIYNPYNATNDFNFNLTVSVSDYVSCVQYPLLTNIGFNGLQSTYSDNSYFVALDTSDNTSPEYLQYDVDSQGNTTTSPAISVPQGGNNIIVNDNEDGGIDNFIEKILNLFTAPIRYIQNLVDSGSSFMAWISQLWYWLPPEVGVIIGSALAVIVVIGAIKLLWK